MYQQAVKSFLGFGPSFGSIAGDGKRPLGGAQDGGYAAASNDPTLETRNEAELAILQIEQTMANLRAELAPYLPSGTTFD